MKRIRRFLESRCVVVEDDWSERVEAYYNLLIERNKQVNLTRIVDYEDYLIKHVLDSLLIVDVWPQIKTTPYRMLDIGCGGGVPGLILAITFPHLLCSEVDSKHKKAAAVHDFIETLGIENAEALQANALELSHTVEYREQIDIVIARAVGHTCKLMNQARRFLTPEDGVLIAYKTPTQIDKEREEVQREAQKRNLKLGVEASRVLELPDGVGSRQFWIMRQKGRVRSR